MTHTRITWPVVVALILHAFAGVAAVVEIVLSSMGIASGSPHGIAGAVHGGLCVLYIITWFAMFKRASLLVSTAADLIAYTIFAVSGVVLTFVVGLHIAALALPAVLVLAFLFEAIYVRACNVSSGKLGISLFRLASLESVRARAMTKHVPRSLPDLTESELEDRQLEGDVESVFESGSESGSESKPESGPETREQHQAEELRRLEQAQREENERQYQARERARMMKELAHLQVYRHRMEKERQANPNPVVHAGAASKPESGPETREQRQAEELQRLEQAQREENERQYQARERARVMKEREHLRVYHHRLERERQANPNPVVHAGAAGAPGPSSSRDSNTSVLRSIGGTSMRIPSEQCPPYADVVQFDPHHGPTSHQLKRDILANRHVFRN